MSEPKDLEEFNTRYHQNTYLSGFGLNVKQHMACPFCAAKDWAEVLVLDLEKSLAEPKKCTECGRSAVVVFTKTLGGVSFGVYQTEGKDPPEWIPIPRKPSTSP